MRYFFSVIVLLSLVSISEAAWRDVFEKEFLMAPWGEGPKVEKNVCIECHASEMIKPEFREIPSEWRKSWHYENGVSCHDCHGGDPKDAAMSMSPERGFIGVPKYKDIPEFCGKCHIGILENYHESGHGKALRSTGKGPNCVTCHGSHNIQKASIEIINERLCTKCHSYEKAKTIKAALLLNEKKIKEIEGDLKILKSRLIYTEDDDKILFRTHAEFRILFHTTDVNLVKGSTDEFERRLSAIEERVQKNFRELNVRQNFSSFILFIFIGLGIAVFLLGRRSE
jgi:nitrate/TMAO reductase-like tetraheme cytochrome c subunit